MPLGAALLGATAHGRVSKGKAVPGEGPDEDPPHMNQAERSEEMSRREIIIERRVRSLTCSPAPGR